MPQSTKLPDASLPPARGRTWAAALCAAWAAGAAAMVLEYGFRDGARPVGLEWLRIAELAVAAVMAIDWAARLAFSRPPRAFLIAAWGEPATAAVAVIVAAAGMWISVPGATPLHALAMQGYLIIALALRAAEMKAGGLVRRAGPALIMLAGAAALCLAGAGLLMLPASSPETTSSQYRPMYFIDALFLAVSAVTCTGLHIRDIGTQLAPLGQAVIFCLFQAGGIGIIIFGTALATFIGKSLAVTSSRKLTEIAASGGRGQFVRLARFVVLWSLVIEAVGAAMLCSMFAGVRTAGGAPMSPLAAIWYSLFHSASAFCNAGFSLYVHNLAAGIGQSGWPEPLRANWQILGVVAPLIMMGGIGFPVLADCGGFLRALAARLFTRGGVKTPRSVRHRAPFPQLTVYTKEILWASAVLVLAGALGLVAVEPRPGKAASSDSRHRIGSGSALPDDWENMDMRDRIRQGLFESVAARTGGMSTLDAGQFSDAGKCWLCGLMVIGGSPASAAGGMKLLTLTLIVAAIWAFIRRRQPEAMGRPMSPALILRTGAAGALYLCLVAIVALAMAVLMRPGYAFVDLLFESCSACGNVGLSTGVTDNLGEDAKGVLMAGMFVGRLGMLGFLLATVARPKAGAGKESPIEPGTPPEELLLA